MYESHRDSGDVTFLVGKNGAEVKAHKFILMCRSSVFFSMFEGQESSLQQAVKVEDIQEDIFLKFLQFLYTDDVCVTIDNFGDLMYCAKKYDIETLSALCKRSLQSLIKPDLVCKMMEFAHQLDDREIIDICLKTIELNTPSFLYTDSFMNLCSTCVYKITQHDRVFAPEDVVFQQVCKWPDSHVHGPCRSGNFKGIEFDDAYCIPCDFWPPSALAWIDRSYSWPSPGVIDDIIRKGCHFVAIGHKLGNHEENEWRISFAYAEQQLVYSMNHCQFLTYGLLKLILKEIITKNVTEGLLSSYHMKTAVFWVIQQNVIPYWYPENLLECFRVCFKLLLQRVYEGVCPNFFIPENNMFLTKMVGKSQRELFLEVHGLYEKGIALLQQSYSIRSFTVDFFCNPRQCISFDQHSEDWEVVFDSDLFREICNNDAIFTQNLNRCLHLLRSMEYMISLRLKNYTTYQILMAQKLTVTILQSTAFLLHSRCANIIKNKKMYKADKISCYMLKLAAKLGFVSDKLYIVMYYYKTFRHIKARKILEIANIEFQEPYLMYMSDADDIYTAEVGGQSFSTKMRRAVVGDIRLSSNIHYIDELMQEQRLMGQIEGTIHISPFVMLLMLEFLCYRQFNEQIAAVAIYDLKNIVAEGDFIRPCTRDICWQILGICQQLQGDLWGALESYVEAVKEFPFHNLKNATKLRIQSLDK
ncbi:uncharacterized protein LOC134281004 [Saccostrea cucullata]|uniref:uncharacterized protein LOC134281004 n=1 Tax=Saccostrea cuccullata TaxID=36930 RepID=UPI002ECFDB4E